MNVAACGGGTIGALVVVTVRFDLLVALNGSTCRMPTILSTTPRYLTTSCARLAIYSLLIDGLVLFCAGSETRPSIVWRSRLRVTTPPLLIVFRPVILSCGPSVRIPPLVASVVFPRLLFDGGSLGLLAIMAPLPLVQPILHKLTFPLGNSFNWKTLKCVQVHVHYSDPLIMIRNNRLHINLV